MMTGYQPGRYLARITHWGLTPAKTGTLQFYVQFTVQGLLDPAQPGEPVACDQYKRTIFRPITENTIERVVEDLQHLGYDKESFDQLNREHPQAHDFGDQEIEVECRHETWEGKTREKWQFAWGAGAGWQPKELAGGEVKKLNALFGKHLKKGGKVSGNGGTTRQPQPASKTTEQQAEEIF